MTPESTGEQRPGAGKSLYWAATVALLLGMTALYQATMRQAGGMTVQMSADGSTLVILQRQRSGHFTAEGAINGHPVEFLVDTGATDVAISEKTARAMGLNFGPKQVILTAAGPVQGWATRLDSVQVGIFNLRNVRASISPGLGKEVLLGMSFLRHFSLVQEGETLVISQPGKS